MASSALQMQMLATISDYYKQAGMEIVQVVIPQERTADRPYWVANPGLEVLMASYGPARSRAPSGRRS